MVAGAASAAAATLAKGASSLSAWSPARYALFRSERLRPAADLLARVPKIAASQPQIIDAGSGDGSASKLLLERWPSASLECLDSSEEMLDAARADTALSGRLVTFTAADIHSHFAESSGVNGTFYDLVFANASLHW